MEWLRVLIATDERVHPRTVIDRATALLMTQGPMTAPQAFRWLQRTAMNLRTSMYAVAKNVIERPLPNAGSSHANPAGLAARSAGRAPIPCRPPWAGLAGRPTHSRHQ